MSGTYTESILTDSVGSLSSSRTLRSPNKAQSTLISKTYKQASNLFLTRRLPEALQALKPIIAPPKRDEEVDDREDSDPKDPAPIATASKNARVKVWNLYITLLNAIVELGPEEGKAQFGSTQWRSLAAKARDGTIWEDVVRDGYHGREGRVDADVISNLATLLLSHSPSQTLNQQRLETYLATSGEYTLDISDRFETSSQVSSDFHPTPVRTNGTNTPRDLNSRLKIIELYALHVLPRNEEWDYAQEFVSMSEVLDDERRELFLQTLYSLKDQKQEDDDRGEELRLAQLEAQERKRKVAEETQHSEKKSWEERELPEADNRHHKRSDSEKDYGIEDASPIERVRKETGPHGKTSRGSQPGSAKLSRRSQGSKRPPNSVYKRGIAIINAVQHLLLKAAGTTSESPTVLLRTLIFLVALLLALGRRDSREWLARVTSVGWVRLKQTIGMGTKVSYI